MARLESFLPVLWLDNWDMGDDGWWRERGGSGEVARSADGKSKDSPGRTELEGTGIRLMSTSFRPKHVHILATARDT